MSARTLPLTLVLLPGMDGTGEMFAPLVAALGNQFNLKIISYPVDGAMGYGELTEIAYAQLPKNECFVLLGESFSGPVAITLAARAPANLVGLILCATFSANPQPALVFSQNWLKFLPIKFAPPFLAEKLLLGNFSTPALRAALAQSLAQVSATALRTRMAAVLSVDVTTQLAKIQIPVAYLRATHDRLVPRSASAHVLAHCIQAREIVFDAPHFLLQTCALKATSCIHHFCAQFNPTPD